MKNEVWLGVWPQLVWCFVWLLMKVMFVQSFCGQVELFDEICLDWGIVVARMTFVANEVGYVVINCVLPYLSTLACCVLLLSFWFDVAISNVKQNVDVDISNFMITYTMWLFFQTWCCTNTSHWLSNHEQRTRISPLNTIDKPFSPAKNKLSSK